MSCELSLEKNLDSYLAYEKIKENREFIENLAKDLCKRNELERLINQRLLFGTAGIRGPMGPGYGQMNDLVIIQTSQGLASYLLEYYSTSKNELLSRGIIIGHDARHNSSRFARLAAVAFLQQNIRVKFSELITPTPVIAFGVRKYNCCAGIVVTASHNPKNDNGYKVYWSNGAQILSPHDKNIQRHIEMEANLKPWLPDAWANEGLAERYPNLFECIHEELTTKYFKFINDNILQQQQQQQQQEQSLTCNREMRIAYTAMHGVGHKFLTRALEMANFKEIFPVKEQCEPDPDFPTIEFPNPEEFGALDLALQAAKSSESTLILANDPDADRCAAALYEPKSGRQRILTGNELGALLGWWLWHKRANRVGGLEMLANKSYMLTTAVSSRFLQSMAQLEGFNFVETLTGFKYMGNEAERIHRESSENVVLFAYEEAIGYMVDAEILDKDGITAALQLALCADYLKREYKRTLEDQLNWLHLKYGFHFNINSYYLCYEPQVIREIFHTLQQNFPTDFGQQFNVTRVRDQNLGFDSATSDKKTTLPTSSSSFMVTFWINSGEITFTIRTSGTEPKIKYYSEIIAQLTECNGGEEELRIKLEAQERLQLFVRLAIERCLAPNKFNLLPAATTTTSK